MEIAQQFILAHNSVIIRVRAFFSSGVPFMNPYFNPAAPHSPYCFRVWSIGNFRPPTSFR